jgi:hypothetical protein
VQISRRTRLLGQAGDTTAHHVLVDEGRLSGKDTKTADERDRVCEQLPAFEDALASGRCTAGHLDAVASHTKDLSDTERADLALVVDDLVDNAAEQPVGVFDATTKALVDKIREIHRPDTADEELQRQRQASKVKRWTDRATGMKHTMVTLDPIRDATLWTAINHHLTRLRTDPANHNRPYTDLQVEAFLAATSSGEPAERIPEIILVVDAATACHGRHDTTVCETVDGVAVPPGAAQRMCCEAILTAVVVNPDGTVDQICEQQRTANRKQRRMLAAMYSTCAHPHCQVAFSQCRIHHIEWFSRGGKTILANMIPLCDVHHHLVHEGHWNLTIDTQRRLTWYRPDGTTWHTDTGPNRTPARQADRRADTANTSSGRAPQATERSAQQPDREPGSRRLADVEQRHRKPGSRSGADRLKWSASNPDDDRHDRPDEPSTPPRLTPLVSTASQTRESPTRNPHRQRTSAPSTPGPDPTDTTPSSRSGLDPLVPSSPPTSNPPRRRNPHRQRTASRSDPDPANTAPPSLF